MYATYKMMSNGTNSTYLNKSLEELCDEYNSTDSVNKRNKIVAAMFCKVFPMILEIQKKYYSLTNEQKVDHALFHLVRSIKYYKKGNVKFSSFFHTHLTNQMKTLLSSENNLKKAAFQNIVRDNDNVLNRYIKTQPTKDYDKSEQYFLENLKNSTYLSTEEKEYCACILAGYDKVDIIREKLDLENRHMDNAIVRKQELSEEKIKELDAKRDQRRIRKIKQSIKDKIALYGKTAIFS